MTPDEASSLASTITSSWPNRGASHQAWESRLEPFDLDTAIDTVAHLIDTELEPPSIARFIAEYRARLAPSIRYLRPDCALCGGTGWQSTTVTRDDYRDRNGTPIEHDVTRPCRCTAGRALADAHQRAVDHNDHELKRTSPITSVVGAEPA